MIWYTADIRLRVLKLPILTPMGLPTSWLETTSQG